MKKIVKIFNNFIKRTIFKVENKTNDKFHVSNFSKYTITAIVVLFIYIFYLSIPLLYDKNWVQNKIVTKLSDEFNINLSNSFDISYRILPKPHYLIKDTKTALAEITPPEQFQNFYAFPPEQPQSGLAASTGGLNKKTFSRSASVGNQVKSSFSGKATKI